MAAEDRSKAESCVQQASLSTDLCACQQSEAHFRLTFTIDRIDYNTPLLALGCPQILLEWRCAVHHKQAFVSGLEGMDKVIRMQIQLPKSQQRPSSTRASEQSPTEAKVSKFCHCPGTLPTSSRPERNFP